VINKTFRVELKRIGVDYDSYTFELDQDTVIAAYENTCSGTYPSYWQDPAFSQMWVGQKITGQQPKDWQGSTFQLSDKYPRQPVDDKANQPWRSEKFDPLFLPETTQAIKKQLGEEYSWLVMEYTQAGNVNRPNKVDWDICENAIRPWFHIPFQTYDPMSGREFSHGLTREAPVEFSVKADDKLVKSTMWAVAFYNATAAYTLGQVWQSDGNAIIPSEHLSFDEGAVIGKPLFNTSSVEQLPVLENMPSWNANISYPGFCECKTGVRDTECTLVQESQQCPRTTQWSDVKLLQFDFAVKDSRASGTQWVYGTFVADGKRKKEVSEPWKRISVLGIMWGNDTPPAGELAFSYPDNPAENGFMEEIINWDMVAELNRYGGSVASKRMGHLGCNNRLNGPADNANSSCLSCHGSASVPDQSLQTPPLLSQFSPTMTFQCVMPDSSDSNKGKDRSETNTIVKNNISFDAIDGVYFANVPASTAFNMMANNQNGKRVNIMPDDAPNYRSGSQEWISLDFSLQLSISLNQWMQWQTHQGQPADSRVHTKEIYRGR